MAILFKLMVLGLTNPETIDTSHWKKVGPKLGSNPGGTYHDEAGQPWYVKHSKSDDHAKYEVLAGKLYRAANTPVIEPHLVSLPGGRLGTASRWQPTDRAIKPNSARDRAEATKHFATHAWLANWDAAGLVHDNQAPIGGKMHTIDVGGALNYRAQGGPKGAAFDHEANEWHSLRNPDINEQNAELFGRATPEQLRASASKVTSVPDETIHALVKAHGPGRAKEKTALAKKLIARRQHIGQLAAAE